MIKIVTDTTAALSREYCRRHDIDVVPQIIRFGEETFLEGIEMDEPEFLKRLKSSAELPATAAPAPGLFDEVYRQAAEKGDTILSIHPSTDVSGTVASATVARDLYAHSDIRVLDMRTIGGCLGEAVKLAAEWRDAGCSIDQIEADLRNLIPRCRTYFLVATLEYLRRNGRIGGASSLIGSVLQIKPILQLSNGRVEPLDKVRTYQKALERLKELIMAECPHAPAARLSVMHADVRDDADRLRAELGAALGLTDIPLYSLGPAITTHAGPGTLAVGFFAN
ncbi:MAG TPA: DegV family protein [Anaerolineae bacterium]|nr:DegV family protein [Anaerolineae bacterium]